MKDHITVTITDPGIIHLIDTYQRYSFLDDTPEDAAAAVCEIVTNWEMGYSMDKWWKDYQEMNRQTRKRRILKKRKRMKETGHRVVVTPLSPGERRGLL